MKPLAIRHHQRSAAAMQLIGDYWRAQGLAVQRAMPPPGAVLARAITAEGVELLVDLRAWFGHNQPEKSGLRADLISADEIRDLFHYSGAAISVILPGETEQPLTILAAVNGGEAPDNPLPVVSTSCGPGWLTVVSEDYRSNFCQALPSLLHDGLPLRLELVLGCSELSYRYLKRLQPGDILLVNQLKETVQIGDRTLAKYRQQEDYFMLEDIYDDDDDHYSPLHEHQNYQPQRIGMNNIPVQLTFIINELTMTLEELSALHVGDVIAAGEGGENSVRICANGALLAKGELVMADERLGVEIQTLCHEAQYGK